VRGGLPRQQPYHGSILVGSLSVLALPEERLPQQAMDPDMRQPSLGGHAQSGNCTVQIIFLAERTCPVDVGLALIRTEPYGTFQFSHGMIQISLLRPPYTEIIMPVGAPITSMVNRLSPEGPRILPGLALAPGHDHQERDHAQTN